MLRDNLKQHSISYISDNLCLILTEYEKLLCDRLRQMKFKY